MVTLMHPLLRCMRILRVWRRGQVATAMLFIVVFLFLLVFFMMAAPLASRFSAEVTATGVELLKDTNNVAAEISDENISATITGIASEAVTAMETNTVIGLTLSQYSWVMLVAIVALVMYLRSRVIVERERRGLV